MKKQIAAIPLLCILLFVLCGAVYPLPTVQFYVNDFAQVLSDETESYIMEKSAALAQQTGAQIVVATVETLAGEEPQSYALNLARAWGIGGAEQDNGVLILLAPTQGEIRVEVGRGLEGALNDAKVGRMIDLYALEAYKSGVFDTGTFELYSAVLSQVMTEYGLQALPGYEPERSDAASGGIGAVAAIIVFVLLVLLGGRGGRGRFYGGFGGGRFGGGSSGGGFSGGGGGFGGGGAGRSF